MNSIASDHSITLHQQRDPTQGLLSAEILLSTPDLTEDATTFNALRDKLMADFAPANTIEELLVDRVVCDVWRMRRVLAVERNEIYQRMSEDLGLEDESLTALQISPEALIEAGVVAGGTPQRERRKIRVAERITEDDLEDQKARVRTVECCDLETMHDDPLVIDWAVEVPAQLRNCKHVDHSLPPREQARQYVKGAAKATRGRYRKLCTDHERRRLAMMVEVAESEARTRSQLSVNAIPLSDRAMKYESRLQTSFHGNLRQLQALQSGRLERELASALARAKQSKEEDETCH